MNAPQCYVIRTLTVLLLIISFVIPSGLCGLFIFFGASYRTDICLCSRNMLNVVATPEAKLAVQFPDFSCKLCFKL